jgi:hypothetical protein
VSASIFGSGAGREAMRMPRETLEVPVERYRSYEGLKVGARGEREGKPDDE